MAVVVLESWHAFKQYEGREIAISDWLQITQERVRQFAEVTEDRQWIHLDQERARRESPYGSTIAHGFLTLSLLPCLIRQSIQIPTGVRLSVNYGLNRVRFPAAVRVAANIRARIALQSLSQSEDYVQAIMMVSVEAQGETKPCCVAECVMRYYL
jgi:acyl dehydratase